jgi:hypothetical protein
MSIPPFSRLGLIYPHWVLSIHWSHLFTGSYDIYQALHRVMAYQRPYLPLQDSDFFEWSYNMSSQYHQIELTLGMWPGYFSGDAAGAQYAIQHIGLY